MGPAGIDGVDGEDGIDGIDGCNGTDGINGTKGDSGPIGPTVSALNKQQMISWPWYSEVMNRVTLGIIMLKDVFLIPGIPELINSDSQFCENIKTGSILGRPRRAWT